MDVGGGFSELLDEAAVGVLVLIVVAGEGHLGENHYEVVVADDLVVEVHVGDLREGADGALGGDEAVLVESIGTRNELLAHFDGLLHYLEFAVAQVVGKDTEAIADCLHNKIRKIIIRLSNFVEFGCNLIDSVSILASISILNVVTEEAKYVKQFILSQLLVGLELLAKEAHCIVSYDGKGAVLEDFAELASQFHRLLADLADLGEVVLHAFDVFFIDFLFFGLLLHDIDGGLLECSG